MNYNDILIAIEVKFNRRCGVSDPQSRALWKQRLEVWAHTWSKLFPTGWITILHEVKCAYLMYRQTSILPWILVICFYHDLILSNHWSTWGMIIRRSLLKIIKWRRPTFPHGCHWLLVRLFLPDSHKTLSRSRVHSVICEIELTTVCVWMKNAVFVSHHISSITYSMIGLARCFIKPVKHTST